MLLSVTAHARFAKKKQQHKFELAQSKGCANFFNTKALQEIKEYSRITNCISININILQLRSKKNRKKYGYYKNLTTFVQNE